MYPVEQLMQDLMNTVALCMPYIIPAAAFSAAVAFIVRWFMVAIDLGSWAFGNRK